MAKPFKGMPLGGTSAYDFPHDYMHPIMNESVKIDEKIPWDIRNTKEKLKDTIEELNHIASNTEDMWRESINIFKDFKDNKLESHSYYIRERIPVLNYDYVMGCLTKQDEWLPSKLNNIKNKCNEATEIIDTKCKTDVKSDECQKALKDQQEYCVEIDEGKALQYEQDCALLRYAIGAVEVAKAYLKTATDDINMIGGGIVLGPNPKEPNKLRAVTENELLERNKKMAFLSNIANELIDVGYQHI